MSVNLGNDTKATSPVRTPDEAKESKYEPKQNKKIVRLLTVIAYVISVSMAAIILSLYYVFLWDPQQLKSPNRDSTVDTIDTSHFSVPGEVRVPPDTVMDSQPTPKVLPLLPETYNTAHQQTQNAQSTATQSISSYNNHQQSSAPSSQLGISRDTSPTGSGYMSDDIRRQQEHGQPPLSTSA